jgi:hypothetical protein
MNGKREKLKEEVEATNVFIQTKQCPLDNSQTRDFLFTLIQHDRNFRPGHSAYQETKRKQKLGYSSKRKTAPRRFSGLRILPKGSSIIIHV